MLRRGGAWNLLGAFALEAGTGNRIVLNAAAADGTVVADAIRIVRAVAAGEIAYVHTDHLGQPQKLTDATATLLWDRVALPFGATHSEAGLGETSIRFPGQWADAESGLHYNYFRDYDPSLGRYIESDPIGLAGGLNTYGYVGGESGWADRPIWTSGGATDSGSLAFTATSYRHSRHTRKPRLDSMGHWPNSRSRRFSVSVLHGR